MGNLLISLENGLVEDASLKLPNSTTIQAKLYPTFITQQLQEIETWFQKQKLKLAKIGTFQKIYKLLNSTQIQTKLYPTFITQQLQEIETWLQKNKNNCQAKIGNKKQIKNCPTQPKSRLRII